MKPTEPTAKRSATHLSPRGKRHLNGRDRRPVNGVKFHLAAHEKGKTPAPSASHENWLEEKRADGWKYGPVKDPAKKEHPCYVLYDELPVEQRLKDYLFGAVVSAFAKAQ